MDSLSLSPAQVRQLNLLVNNEEDSFMIEGTNLVGVVCVRVGGLTYLVAWNGDILSLNP